MSKNEDLLARYDSLDLKKLPEEVKKNGFVYRLVMRAYNKCLYAQHDRTGRILAYELFLNKIVPHRIAMERFAKQNGKEFVPEQYPEYAESFPNDEDFGQRAWSIKNAFDAQKRFEVLG